MLHKSRRIWCLDISIPSLSSPVISWAVFSRPKRSCCIFYRIALRTASVCFFGRPERAESSIRSFVILRGRSLASKPLAIARVKIRLIVWLYTPVNASISFVDIETGLAFNVSIIVWVVMSVLAGIVGLTYTGLTAWWPLRQPNGRFLQYLQRKWGKLQLQHKRYKARRYCYIFIFSLYIKIELSSYILWTQVWHGNSGGNV